jgi:rSAM/selenodomain-associated transferase 1
LSDRTLVVFVRYPRVGTVKTRLVPALGAELAADLYRALAEGVLAATAPRVREYERLVFYDPPEAGDEMRGWLPAGRLRRQAPGDLGTRMANAFAKTFARGARRVALIGSDVPGLSRVEVGEALAALERVDLVLGPAQDGGYYLVALRGPQPSLFDGIAWGTPQVLDETLSRASAAGLSVAQLARRRDVDTIEDLQAEWPRVAALLRHDPALQARLAEAIAIGARRH